jgi:hypothetical protein
MQAGTYTVNITGKQPDSLHNLTLSCQATAGIHPCSFPKLQQPSYYDTSSNMPLPARG